MTLNELSCFSNYDSHFNSRAAGTTSLGTFHSLQPTLSGPSHDYELYRQQTGIPLGAFASTLAVNQQQQCSVNYQFNAEDDFLDFESAPDCDESPMDTEFDSSISEPAYFYSAQSTIAPDGSNIVVDQPLSSLSTQVSNLGRLWPGMHQQQAEEEARQKHKQKQVKQQQIHDDTTNSSSQKPHCTKTRVSKTVKDPIVEDKISQILKSMRQTNTRDEVNDDNITNQILPSCGLLKREEEMDDDEKLLASEEGKKLSSKERRQLRNKVSARAFRSRRKEYINQLEDEIALKTNENGDLRAQNQALIEENTRLSDLTRILISSPSFSGFIDTLAMSPIVNTNVQHFQQQAEKNVQPQQLPNKDINPNIFQQQMQQQYLNTAIIAEPSRDFSTIDFSIEDNPPYQPQVFLVQSVPDTVINFDISYKNCSLIAIDGHDNKINFPQFECRIYPEIMDPDKFVLGFEKFFEDPLFTSSEINLSSLLPKESGCHSPFPTQLSPELLKNIKLCVDSESDAALKRAYRLVAETGSCFKRLSALTRNLQPLIPQEE